MKRREEKSIREERKNKRKENMCLNVKEKGNEYFTLLSF